MSQGTPTPQRMPMPTLLLSPRYSVDSRALRAAAVAAGWDCVRLAQWRIPDWVAEREHLVFYGEPLLAEVVAEQLPFVLLEPPLDWLPALPTRYSKRQVRLMSLGEARELREAAFVKPAELKSFSARVYASGVELPGPETLPAETPVLVQEPVTWGLEVRCFVLDRKVVTSSAYLRHGELVETAEGDWPAGEDEMVAAHTTAAAVLADLEVPLPRAVVLDVGMIEGRGWAVIEANAAWAAGLYGCDPATVLSVLPHALARRDSETKSSR